MVLAAFVFFSADDAVSADARPNIIFCLADDWGWPHAGAYGDPVVKTPTFDRLAREGVLFQQAYVSSPSCTPSRNAIITGQQFYRLGPGANLYGALDINHPNFMFRLRDAGYEIGHWRKAWGPGKFEQGGYTEHPCGPDMPFTQFMESRDANKPFCFWFGTSDPHRPYELGSGRESGMDLDAVPTPDFYPDAEPIRGDIADYYFEVQRWDRDVADVVKLLEDAGVLENTILVMTGDHGMPFPRCKGNLYDWGSRVPLAIRWGRGIQNPGREVTDFVSLTDLAPTFLSAAGVGVPDAMTGRSLMPIFQSQQEGRVQAARSQIVYGRERHTDCQETGPTGYPSRALRTDEYLYIRNYQSDRWPAGTPRRDEAYKPDAWLGDCDNGPTKFFLWANRGYDDVHRRSYDLSFGKRPAEELYVLAADADQVKNVARDPGFAEIKEKLAAQLTDYLKSTGDPRETDAPAEFDAYPYIGGVPKWPGENAIEPYEPASTLPADRYQLDLADGDRVWVAPEFWANRLHDWRVSDGRIECVASAPRLRHRTLTLLTHDIPGAESGSLEIQLRVGLINEDRQAVSPDAAAGLVLGIGAEMDYRSRALIHGATGPGAGYFVGLTAQGRLVAYDLAHPAELERAFAPPGVLPQGDLRDATLKLALREFENRQAVFDVRLSQDQRVIETVLRIPRDRIAGGIALGAHPGSPSGDRTTGTFWFRDLELAGDLVNAHPERALGPILSTMYTIGDKTLKLTAQMFPIADTAPRRVGLQRQTRDGTWLTVDTREIVVPGWTVPFRVDSWDDTRPAQLRVIYPAENPTAEYRCRTTANPVGKTEVVIAGFTGNHMVGRGFERDGYDFAAHIWFPHQEVADAVAFHRPDVLFFSGDQIYEGGSPTFPDTNPENIKLDYLYKWYLWCWSYRDLTRRLPTICIPDDHDVYQGNLWGQGGRKSPDRDHDGGYVHPADFVQMVERTQTSHLPDPYWTEPLAQGLTAYYTDFAWGEVGFAVLEDRKFKSGCNRPDMPPSGSGRPDHFNDPQFDVAKLDLPGLKLLGDEQLAFLDRFVRDWQDQKMKIALSQTIFANLATHHGPGMQRLIADLDSNGWPQSGRNRAIERLRKGFVFHLAGDQHLATIAHHGIEQHGDAMWSFCVPSVANFYPRAWAPKQPAAYSWPDPKDYTGEHRDGFEHPVTVYAATNPGRPTGHEPALLHDGMPGYGIVRMNKPLRTITMECWPRYSDPSEPGAAQYPGWPKTISQFDNYARKPIGYLADLRIRGARDPVVSVTNERTGELVSAVRIRGRRYRVPAFEDAAHTVSVRHEHQEKVFERRTPNAQPETVTVEF